MTVRTRNKVNIISLAVTPASFISDGRFQYHFHRVRLQENKARPALVNSWFIWHLAKVADETAFILEVMAGRVRPARPEDAEALAQLQGGIYEEGRWFVGNGAPRHETLARQLRALDRQMSLFLLAVSNEELCGWLELHRHKPHKLAHVAMLTVAIAAAWRRQGIASELLTRSYRWARRHNVEKIQLNVRAGNTAAIALYEREGFLHEGREARQIREGDSYEDNLLMAKFL